MSRVPGSIYTPPTLSVLDRVTTVVEAVAFWLAVVLPVAYVLVLLGTISSPVSIALVFVGHAVCLYVGHAHGPGRLFEVAV
jgi:hypothetical protein